MNIISINGCSSNSSGGLQHDFWKKLFLLTFTFLFLLIFSAKALAYSWQGTWTSSVGGEMQIEQNDDKVKGTYGGSGRIEGTVSGNTLKGNYWWSNKKGIFELRMTADGKSYTGSWSRTGKSGSWNGKRLTPLENSESTDNNQTDSKKNTNKSTGKVTKLGNGLTRYTIWSTAQDKPGSGEFQRMTMGVHKYCGLSYVMSGGFNSACTVSVSRDRVWTLGARDPWGDRYAAESQGCSAICFDE